MSSRSRPRADVKRASMALRLSARMLAPFAQRPAESVTCAVFAALMTGILLNALAFQSARHPSPLFGPPLAIAPHEDAPKPVPRPLSMNAAPAAIAPAAQPVAIPTRPVAAPRDAEPLPTKAPDAIGDMLRAPPAASSAASPANVSAVDATRVLIAQKALMKLGYVIRPDGVMGATTRQAIEKFERERGWPPRGELTPKVLREISARSGLSLE
ncbi:MAG: peptidoglycan-binding protein [Methylobacteriaceae bacterium]|nr:peptidoglycan-binding protein [Methylobacteriaceae bacterium]